MVTSSAMMALAGDTGFAEPIHGSRVKPGMTEEKATRSKL
jgi:hypothetical protein